MSSKCHVNRYCFGSYFSVWIELARLGCGRGEESLRGEATAHRGGAITLVAPASPLATLVPLRGGRARGSFLLILICRRLWRQKATPRGLWRGGRRRGGQEAEGGGRDPGGGRGRDCGHHWGQQEDARTPVHVPRACTQVKHNVVDLL